MDISITHSNESTLTKHHTNGSKDVVVFNGSSYPKLQAFINACCDEIKSSSVTVLDKHLGYEVSIHVDGFTGDLMPNAATVLYDNPVDGVEGYTILSNEVKAEVDALAALLP